MFDWKQQVHNAWMTRYVRLLHAMQLVAVGCMIAGFFLVWWDARDPQSYWDLLNRSTHELRARDPNFIGQPLMVLWFLWPVLIASTLRGLTGILVTPVWYRRLALVAWVLALLSLGHYYINWGEDLPERSPLRDGVIGIGFWLTLSSAAILGVLILAEWFFRDPDEGTIFAAQETVRNQDEATAKGPAWQDEFVTCPYCGMLNDRRAEACMSCGNVLFSAYQYREAGQEH